MPFSHTCKPKAERVPLVYLLATTQFGKSPPLGLQQEMEYVVFNYSF